MFENFCYKWYESVFSGKNWEGNVHFEELLLFLLSFDIVLNLHINKPLICVHCIW